MLNLDLIWNHFQLYHELNSLCFNQGCFVIAFFQLQILRINPIFYPQSRYLNFCTEFIDYFK